MDDETKKKINTRYKGELNKGERFWPDSIFKDAIVSFGIFVLLILLATFIGVAAQPKADPSDTSVIPRLNGISFSFQIPCDLWADPPAWQDRVACYGRYSRAGCPRLDLGPFIDRSPYRYYGKRVLPISIMAIMVVDIVMLSLLADVPR